MDTLSIRAKNIELVETAKVVPNKKNRNTHSTEQIERLCEIIRFQGFRSPLIISNRSGMLVSGHGRLLAAKKLKMKHVPVIYQDFDDDDQEFAAGVSENAIASWAELDMSGINLDLADLNGQDFNIDLLGIKDFVLDMSEKSGEDEDAVPEVKEESNVKLGDLFTLGSHRLLCGDSTDKAQVERLMSYYKCDCGEIHD